MAQLSHVHNIDKDKFVSIVVEFDGENVTELIGIMYSVIGIVDVDITEAYDALGYIQRELYKGDIGSDVIVDSIDWKSIYKSQKENEEEENW